MESFKDYEREIDFGQLVRALWKGKWLIILAGILGAAALGGYGIIKFNTNPFAKNYTNYKVSARYYAQGEQTEEQTSRYYDYRLDSYTILFSNEVIEAALQAEGIEANYQDIYKMLKADTEGTNLVKVTMTGDNPEFMQKMLSHILEIGLSRILEIQPGILEVRLVDDVYLQSDEGNINRTFLNAKNYASTGLALGLFFAALVILVLALADTTIKNEKDIKLSTGLPTVGVLSKLKKEGWSKERKEELRKIRISVQMLKPEARVISFLSYYPKEGKSLLAYRYAQSLASIGKSTLLVDADFRTEDRELLSGVEEKGTLRLSMETVKTAEADKFVCKTENEFLYCVLAKKASENADLLNTDSFRELMGKWRVMFDYIIIDTADLKNYADASLCAGLSDASVLVVESGKVRYHIFQTLAQQLKDQAIPAAGVILNKK